MTGPLDPSLDQLSLMNSGQQLAMADEFLPPKPGVGEERLLRADPLQPRPLASNPNLGRMQEIRGRLRELDAIDTQLQRGNAPNPSAYYRAPRDETWIDRRTLRGAMHPDDMDRMRAMVNQGMSHRAIAEAFGVGKANVTRRIKAMLEKGEATPPEKTRAGNIFGLPGEGARPVPSMPKFDFKDPLSKDNFEDYLKALDKHMNDVKAYFNVSGSKYG